MIPEVVFPDKTREAAVREALEKLHGPLTTEELNRLEVLRATGREIEELTGIGRCVNLTTLRLGDNRIADITALASLTNLDWLELNDNLISDITPLASLTTLTELWLEHNQISDVSPLASLTDLKVNYIEYDLSSPSITTFDDFRRGLSKRFANSSIKFS